jgi:hypothetical protein
VQLRVGVSGRDDLDGEVRRFGPIAHRTSDSIRPLAADEGCVGRADGVRVSREDEARLGREPTTGVAVGDVTAKKRGYVEGDRSVLGAGGWHLQDLSLDQLTATAVVGKRQQRVGSDGPDSELGHREVPAQPYAAVGPP